MPLDPKARALLDEFAASGRPPLESTSVLQARAYDADVLALQLPREHVEGVRDLLVDGSAGRLPARLYHPRPGTRLPVLVFFHGGGYVLGDLEGSDEVCRAIANAATCAVVSVGYRLAPETQFPGPVEDCYAATAWVAQHADALEVTAEHLAVGGESAGGGLAAAVALMARDRGTPSLAYQVLVYPVTAPARGTTMASYTTNGDDYLLTRAAMEWFWDHYVADESDGRHGYASPLLAEDHTGLPPALVITAELDPLHDEGVALAAALRESGVPVDLLDYDGAIHGFLVMSGRMDHGRRAVVDIAARLRADRQRPRAASAAD